MVNNASLFYHVGVFLYLKNPSVFMHISFNVMSQREPSKILMSCTNQVFFYFYCTDEKMKVNGYQQLVTNVLQNIFFYVPQK